MAAACAAEVPVSIKEIYESDDRNFLLVTAAVIERVVRIREEAMKKAREKHG